MKILASHVRVDVDNLKEAEQCVSKLLGMLL
jgi:hypothetical protein